MKLKSIISLLTASLISIQAFAGTTMTELHYKAIDDDGKTSYDIIIKIDSISWKELSGIDKGQSDTAKIKHENITDTIEVMQWKGHDKSYNTLVIDHDKLKYVISGFMKHKAWLMKGKLERIIQ